MENETKYLNLNEVKNELTDQILSMFTIVGVLVLVISFMKSLALGIQPILILHIVIWVVCLFMYIKRHKTPQRTKAYLIVGLLYLIGSNGLFTFGLSGSGSLALLATTIITGLLISRKASIAALLLSILTIVLTCYLQHIDYLTIPLLIEKESILSAWYMEFVVFALFSTAILLAINQFFRYLIHVNNQLSQKVAQSSERAKQSERLLKAVLDALPYRVFWKDEKLNYLGANTAFLKDGGLTSIEEIIGKSDHELPWHEQAELFRADDTEVINSKQAKLNIEEPFTASDGVTKYLLTNKVPLIDEQHHVFGILGAFDDISAQKELELELRQAKSAADQASVAKTEFLSNMSHEIRTPLNGINGLLELCLSTELSEQQRDYLNKTNESARLLNEILNDVLDISKIEAGKFELELLDFNLNKLLENVSSFVKPLADEKGIKLVVSHNVPEGKIYHGDPTRLMQILLNLANNAVKFTEKGQVSINCNITEQEQRPYLNCEFIDSGIGISADQLPNLFTNFNQADSSMSRRFGGTGLGLAIVKKIIDLMNGNLNVSSELGKGSSFAISLPLQLAQGTTEQSLKEIELNVSLNDVDILLVEDNRVNQVIAKKILNQYGANVSVANDGIEGLSTLGKQQFDIVLMDIQMPNMNGCDAIKEIRLQDKYKSLPVIALTANVMSHEIKSYYELGFNAHVGKPFKGAELVSKIYELIYR